MYPLNIFYYSLFYTDTLSTTTLVATYWLCLRQSNAASPPSTSPVSLVGQVSLLLVRCKCDQMFSCSIHWVNVSSYLLRMQAASLCVLARQTNAVWLLFFAGTDMLQSLVAVQAIRDDTALSPGSLVGFIGALWRHKLVLLRRTWPLLLPVLGFAGFVIKTGSIVLGTSTRSYYQQLSINLLPPNAQHVGF
jgi:hypothetical protein